jgi:hypothetical protein
MSIPIKNKNWENCMITIFPILNINRFRVSETNILRIFLKEINQNN